MAYETNTATTALTSKIYIEKGATTTPRTNITGAAATLYLGEVDNRMNPDQAIWLKMYNHASPTNASDPLIILYTAPSSIGRFVFPEGATFSTALSVLVATSPLVNQGTNPTNQVTVKLLAE